MWLSDTLKSHWHRGEIQTRKDKEKVKDKTLPMLLDAGKREGQMGGPGGWPF